MYEQTGALADEQIEQGNYVQPPVCLLLPLGLHCGDQTLLAVQVDVGQVDEF